MFKKSATLLFLFFVPVLCCWADSTNERLLNNSPEAKKLIGSRWILNSDDKSSFEIEFGKEDKLITRKLRSGRGAKPWWCLEEKKNIELVFNNGLCIYKGEFIEPNKMKGTAKSWHGGSWNWTAKRIPNQDSNSVMAKTQPTKIKLMTWNIQVGYDKGILQNNWCKRRETIVETIQNQNPDVFCLQEGSQDQIKFLKTKFVQYSMVGVGRDDGKNKGEHCATFFKKELLENLGSGTFWFSDSPDKPGNSWDGIYQRICTWVKLSFRNSKATICIFNSHFPLNPLVQEKSAKLLLKKQKEICPDGNVILLGDFNCQPKSGARRLFTKNGFSDSANSVLKKDVKTYHLKGLELLSLDGVYASKGISVSGYKTAKVKCRDTWASDHLAITIDANIDGR